MFYRLKGKEDSSRQRRDEELYGAATVGKDKSLA